MEKIIHQTWKNGELNKSDCVLSVKTIFHDYEYKFWTDEENDELIRLNYPEFYSFFNELLPVEKIDFIRYLYIYHHGGVYLDVDVKMNKPLVLEGADVFLCDQTKEHNESNGLVLDPFFLAGKSNCQFFYYICKSMMNGTIYNILSQKTDGKYDKILYKTGPFMLTKFYLLNKHKYQIKILNDVFTTKHYEIALPTQQFHGIHLHANSWLEAEDRRP